jgi:hypothetical protein
MREKNRRIGIGIAAALLLLGGASAAHAQYRQPRGYPPPPPPGYYPPPAYRGMYRQGLVFGLGIGGGAISASGCGSDCGGAFALQGDIGGMLNPQLALVFDVWVNLRDIPQTDITATSGIYTGALQFFVTDIVWLKGGVGFGQYRQSSDTLGTNTDEGLALLAAGGVEVVQSQNFALDIQLRLGHAFYSVAKDMTNVALMLGVNWY